MQVIDWILKLIGLAFLLAFQILVLNNLELGKYLHPYVYPMFIFMLPITTPRWLTMMIAFAIGLLVDMFNNTPGMHAAACVVIAFARPEILKLLTPPTGYEAVISPGVKHLSIAWFAVFSVIMIFLHHTVYFFVEILSFKHLGYTLLTILCSGIISTVLILILTFLFTSKKEKR